VSKVLIVDDEPDLLLMLRVSLEAVGFETGLAADGDVALQRMRAERFDLVLLDVMMPVLDGWSVLEALKDDPTAPPVLVVSAKTAQQDRERALSLGATAYITKPFDIDSLVAKLHEVLAAARS
jgi:DNA-binding response OmpR family regulator